MHEYVFEATMWGNEALDSHEQIRDGGRT